MLIEKDRIKTRTSRYALPVSSERLTGVGQDDKANHKRKEIIKK